MKCPKCGTAFKVRSCLHCKKEFSATGGRQQYCSQICLLKAKIKLLEGNDKRK